MFLIKNITSKKYLVVIGLILIIFLVIGSILIIDYVSPVKNLGSKNSKLENVDKIKDQAKALGSISEIRNTGTYSLILEKINVLENPNVSKEDKSNAFGIINERSLGLYSSTNNNELYKFRISLNEFYKLNFPDKPQNTLKPMCLDPKCAENPQPQEILNVIETIKNSNINEAIKENDIQNLTNFGYMGNDHTESKVGNYLIVANDIKNDKNYIEAGLNEKIYNDIVGYIKKTYPEEYKNFTEELESNK